ncbi:SPFH domain / Band 7 family protein [Streptomyces sp. YIM 130001]|uniref:SPFH domain-containing protein n=1 Tax=Streptomyces sp. YIM 130001 TaxID=2259644 RepID=UPI000EDA93F1|nr:SPFH domain-containing protein [Streptomyces sp. YIM 130001]RII19688.1 SPFH domain / Band 7 family protein [Streptomyces sp. YIM 130001]
MTTIAERSDDGRGDTDETGAAHREAGESGRPVAGPASDTDSASGGADGAAEGEGIPEGRRSGSGARSARLIQNEATTEIPVHLLFRDDPGAVPVRVGSATPGGADATPRSDPGATGRSSGIPWNGAHRAGARTAAPPSLRVPPAFAQPARQAPPVDASITELEGPSLSGAAAAAVGAAGLACCAAGFWWAGVLPPLAVQLARLPVLEGAGLGPEQWALIAGSGALSLFSFGGIGRGRVGRAWVVSLFGRYRGTVRRTGLVWLNPFLRRRRIDVRLRHWQSEPMPAVDAHGVAVRAAVLVAWRVKDTARAALAVEDHTAYLRACVEAATARVMSRLPLDAPASSLLGDRTPTLRDAEAVGDALTRILVAEAAPAGIEVFSAQPTRIEYAPEVAEAMGRRRVAELEARHRDTVLTQVVDSVEDTVSRLTRRGLVELDDGERKALVKDLTVAFCTGQSDR